MQQVCVGICPACYTFRACGGYASRPTLKIFMRCNLFVSCASTHFVMHAANFVAFSTCNFWNNKIFGFGAYYVMQYIVSFFRYTFLT